MPVLCKPTLFPLHLVFWWVDNVPQTNPFLLVFVQHSEEEGTPYHSVLDKLMMMVIKRA